MLHALDLIPHAPTFVEGKKYHPDLVRHLQKLGKRYDDAEIGGVLVVSPHFYDEYAFPVNPDDPLEETADWEGFDGLADVARRRWDGLPFLADAMQRAGRNQGVPITLKSGPIDHSIWAPLRWMFPSTVPMPVLPVGLSGLSNGTHLRMGRAIREAVSGAQKPIAILVSSNLTHRPDKIRWDGKRLSPAGMRVDRALLRGLEQGDWSEFADVSEADLDAARPEGGLRLWSLIRGMTSDLDGELLHYSAELGAYGMALVHYEPQRKSRAA